MQHSLKAHQYGDEFQIHEQMPNQAMPRTGQELEEDTRISSDF
jgi:hypothetical protein